MDENYFSSSPAAATVHESKKYGTTWWGRQWLEAVENHSDSNRLAKGRLYAQMRRVFGICLKSGKIDAQVQGKHGTYEICVRFDRYNPIKWGKILDRITKSDTLGRILNNELPENIEQVCGVKLIPRNVDAECSCSDEANPCKHIASLYYVLSEEIDAAPQILFTLQGLSRSRLHSTLLAKTGRRTAVPTSSDVNKIRTGKITTRLLLRKQRESIGKRRH